MSDKKTPQKTETKTDAAKSAAPTAASPTTTLAAPAPATVEKTSKMDDLLKKAAAMPFDDALQFTRESKLVIGAMLALREPSELEARCSEALITLRALGHASDLSAEMQKAVKSIIEQAAQAKPGMDEVTTRWRIPRIMIVQGTTTQAARPDSARVGDMFTSAGKVLEKPFPIIPLHFSQENIMFPEGAKIPACQAPDAKLGNPFGKCVDCPHLPFGLQGGGGKNVEQKKTDCQNQIVVIAASTDMTQIYMIQFAKTSRTAGSALQSLAGAQNFPWQQAFLLETEKGKADLGNFFKFKTSATGKDNDAHVQRVAQAVCDLYTAERHHLLALHYRSALSAPAVAAAAETQFQGSKLDAGLAGEVEPYDLGEGTAPAGSARTAAKPM